MTADPHDPPCPLCGWPASKHAFVGSTGPDPSDEYECPDGEPDDACDECGWDHFDDSFPYVDCDEQCHALKEPVSSDDTRAAYEHWAGHEWLGGCSHGA